VPDKSFPESVTSTNDGTFYAGSFNLGGVVMVKSGGKAEQFVKPGAGGSRSVLGVLADEKSGCFTPVPTTSPALASPAKRHQGGLAESLRSHQRHLEGHSAALPDPKALCNDIAVGSDGTAYITDSFTPNVYSLKPGGSALEVFATDPALAPAKDGVGLDGIAFGSDGNLYVTTISRPHCQDRGQGWQAGAVTHLACRARSTTRMRCGHSVTAVADRGNASSTRSRSRATPPRSRPSRMALRSRSR